MGVAPVQALPLNFVCPLCSGLSHVFDSPHTNGHHIFCEQCRFTGSAAKLADRNAAVDGSRHRAPAALKVANSQLWRDCRRSLATARLNSQAEYSAARFAIDPRNTRHSQEWTNREGKLIGLISNALLKQHFDRGLRHLQPSHWPASQLMASERLVQGQQPKSFRSQAAAEQLLILPVSVLPGLISGFHVSFGRGNLDQRGYFPLEPTDTEGGLLWLDQVFSADYAHVVAVADPWFAMRLQAQHLANYRRPLPLTAWTDTLKSSTQMAWKCVAQRKIVVWSPELSWRVFRQSMQANSAIACLPSPSSSFFPTSYRNQLELSPEVRLAAVVSAAIPWQTAAEKKIRNSSPEELFQLAMQIQQDATLGEEFLRSLPAKLANRLFAALPKERNRMQMSLGDHTYEKTPQGIFVSLPDGKKSLVLGLDLEIVRHFIFEKSSFLVLKIAVPGRSAGDFVFRVPELEAREGLLEVLRIYCRELGLPPLITSDDQHTKKLVSILLSFGVIPSSKLPSQLGWDSSCSQLVLPRHTLRLGGEVFRSDPMSPLAGLPPQTHSRPSDSEFLVLKSRPDIITLLSVVIARLLEPAMFTSRSVSRGFKGNNLPQLALALSYQLGIKDTHMLPGAAWPKLMFVGDELMLTHINGSDTELSGSVITGDWSVLSAVPPLPLADLLLYGLQQVMAGHLDLPANLTFDQYAAECFNRTIQEIENGQL